MKDICNVQACAALNKTILDGNHSKACCGLNVKFSIEEVPQLMMEVKQGMWQHKVQEAKVQVTCAE